MTQTDDTDDYRAPGTFRRGVSPEQHVTILMLEEDDRTKALLLDTLEFLGSGETLGNIVPALESALTCAGLAKDHLGIWRDTVNGTGPGTV